MNCPICLDPLDNTVIFSCGHACCQPCYELSAIIACTICRSKITSTTAAPWLNCRSNELEDDSLEPKPKEIVDSRGHELIKTANAIAGIVKPIITSIEAIMEAKCRKTKAIEEYHDQEVRRLEYVRQAKLTALETESQKLLDADAANVKTQEYYNQGLEHLAQTCLLLSTQTKQVLDQALPMYQRKIDDALFPWPFGISPGQPKGSLPSGSGYYVYVEKLRNFIHVKDDVINCGDRSVLIANLIVVKSYDGLIYALSPNRINVYNHKLILVNIRNFNSKVCEFYVYSGKIGVISDNTHNLGTVFKGKEITLPIMFSITAEVAAGTLYVKSNDSIFSYTVVEDILVTSNDSCASHGIFVLNDMLYAYKSNSKKTILKYPRIEDSMNVVYTTLSIKLPPYIKIYPGARNTILCVKGKEATLVSME